MTAIDAAASASPASLASAPASAVGYATTMSSLVPQAASQSASGSV